MLSRYCRRTLAFLAIALFSSSLHAQVPLPSAQVQKDSNLIEQEGSIAAIVEELRRTHTKTGSVFIEQEEIDCFIREGGGGPCASCAGVVVLQTCRGILGLPAIDNPHRAFIESIRDQNVLLNGRVTNNQFVKLIGQYSKYFPDATISTEVLSAPNSPHAVDGVVWGDEHPLIIKNSSSALQVLSFTWTTGDHEVLGRHFVIVQEVIDGQIHVLDPAAPTKKRRFVLEQGQCGRVFLRMPPDLPQRPETFELNTVFTVRIAPNSTHSLLRAPSVDLEHIEAEIDRTAERLRTAGKLRSPRDWRRDTAAIGLPGIDMPKEVGGGGWSAEKTLDVFRYAGRHDLNLRDVVGGAHSRILLKSSSDEVKAIVQQVIRGDAYLAITITEPDFGTDFTGIQTKSTRVDGGYVLNGQKRFNARLEQATHVIVFTQSASGNDGRLSVFVLPINSEGLKLETFGAHGLTGNSYGGLTLNNVFVPNNHRIGGEDDGYKVFNEHFAYWRLMQSATAIGTAERALEMMADRMKTREVYGKPIGRFTHLQQPLGQHRTELTMAYALAKDAARPAGPRTLQGS